MRVSTEPCDAKYSIVIKDEKALLSIRYSRTDENAPEELIPSFQSHRKEALQRLAHPVKDLVKGYTELSAALTLLWQNKKRIIEACDTVRKKGVSNLDEEFHRRVHADIHNYVASAYSFEKIRKNTEPNIPTDGPVQDALQTYHYEKRVIIGLRIYAQKQFTIPFSIATFAGDGPDEYNTTIGIRLDKVNVIDSDVKRHPPDGYSKDASHHYGDIEGKHINIEQRVNLHYQVAGDLLRVIAEHAEDIRGDEIEDYREVVDYTTENSW